MINTVPPRATLCVDEPDSQNPSGKESIIILKILHFISKGTEALVKNYSVYQGLVDCGAEPQPHSL